MSEDIKITYRRSFSVTFEGIALDGTFNNDAFGSLYGVLYECDFFKLELNKIKVCCSSKTINSIHETNINGNLSLVAYHKKNQINNYVILDESKYFLKEVLLTHLRKLLILFSDKSEPAYMVEKEVIVNQPNIICCSEEINFDEIKFSIDGVMYAQLSRKNILANLSDINDYAPKLLKTRDDAIHTSLFWISTANIFPEDTRAGCNFVEKFMFTWMAFNSLYKRDDVGGEQRQIEAFIDDNDEIKNIINNLFTVYKNEIKSFVVAEVRLNNNNDLYNQLDAYLTGTPLVNSPSLEKTLMLCIYAVRCKIFHGENSNKFFNLLRLCIELLEPVIKGYIIKKI